MSFAFSPTLQYLVEHGADVNRGERSSSLHYAASFGRGDIARLLLRRVRGSGHVVQCYRYLVMHPKGNIRILLPFLIIAIIL